MKTRLILVATAAIAFSSCSTYRSGQTPDDVYSSKGRVPVYAEMDKSRYNQESGGDYVDMSDRYLRMKAMNRSRWSAFDEDYSYWNNPMWNNANVYNSFYSPSHLGMFTSPFMGYGYGSGFGYGFGNGMYAGMGFGYSGYYGNPFGMSSLFYPPVVIIGKPSHYNPASYGPRTYNLGTYSTSGGNTYNRTGTHGGSAYYGSGSAPVRVFSSPSIGGSRYPGSYRGSDGGSYNAPRGNYNNNSGSSGSSRSFNSGFSGGSSSGGGSHSGGSSAPTRSFRGSGN